MVAAHALLIPGCWSAGRLPFHPSLQSNRQFVIADEALERPVGRPLRHSVSRVVVPVDPPDLCDLASLVRLPESHDIDHQASLVGGA